MNRFRIDTAWFKQKCKEKGLSQRKMGDLLHINHEALSRVFRGIMPIRIEQATKLAEYFEVSLYEVLRHAGIDLPPPTGLALPIVGSVNKSFHVTPGKHPPLASMPIFEQAAEGVVCNDSKSLFYGWVFAYVPANNIPPLAIGRLSIVQLAGGQKYIRFLKPGIQAGRFDLVSITTGRPFENLHDVSSASPILHILPVQKT